MHQRVLVRLSASVPLRVEEINTLLGNGLSPKLRYHSPGVAAVRAILEDLERQGSARRLGDGWVLTEKGEREYTRLEDHFDNSGGYGDYGF